MRLNGTINFEIEKDTELSTDEITKRMKEKLEELCGEDSLFEFSKIETKDEEQHYLSKILEKVDAALVVYPPDNVDVILNEETGYLYVSYHSHNNSFPLTNSICKKCEVNLATLVKALDDKNVGHCW